MKMKNYIIFYTKSSGLVQINPLEAFCYHFRDGFFHFYLTEEEHKKDNSFKSINKDYIILLEEKVI